jgi:hypothetical protein
MPLTQTRRQEIVSIYGNNRPRGWIKLKKDSLSDEDEAGMRGSQNTLKLIGAMAPVEGLHIWFFEKEDRWRPS